MTALSTPASGPHLVSHACMEFTFPENLCYLVLIVGERGPRRLTVGTTMICQSGSR